MCPIGHIGNRSVGGLEGKAKQIPPSPFSFTLPSPPSCLPPLPSSLLLRQCANVNVNVNINVMLMLMLMLMKTFFLAGGQQKRLFSRCLERRGKFNVRSTSLTAVSVRHREPFSRDCGCWQADVRHTSATSLQWCSRSRCTPGQRGAWHGL